MVLNNQHHYYFIRGYTMKKFVCICAAAIMLTASLAGCGEYDDKNNSASETTVSESSETSDTNSMEEDITDAMDSAETAASDMFDDGTVRDDDGIIGNEDDSESDDKNAEDNTGSESSTEVVDEMM